MAVSLTISRVARGLRQVTAPLLTDAEATTDGEWVSIEGVSPLTVELTGLETGDEVDIRGSNADEKPDNSEAGFGIILDASGAIVTVSDAGTFVKIPDLPIRWIKATVETYASGTINAQLVGHLSG